MPHPLTMRATKAQSLDFAKRAYRMMSMLDQNTSTCRASNTSRYRYGISACWYAES